jgi:hypothetical protein
MAVNSSVDADSDGIDDICDGYIGPAGGDPPGTTGNTALLSASVSAGGSLTGSAGSGLSSPPTAKSAAGGTGTAAPSVPNIPESSGALKPLLRRHGGKTDINWAGFSLLLILLWLIILLAGLWYYREQKNYRHYAYA